MDKAVIMFVCAGGMSSSLVVSKMQKAAEAYDMEIELWATGVKRGGETLKKRDDIDYLLVGPQVRFTLSDLEKIRDDYDRKTISKVADMRDYGMVDGEKILRDTMEILEARHVSTEN